MQIMIGSITIVQIGKASRVDNSFYIVEINNETNNIIFMLVC